MGWKSLGIRKRFASPKEGLLRILRLIRAVDKDDLSPYSFGPKPEDVEEPNSFNTQAYLLAKQRMHEIEGQKAMLIALSRHERWKAGGPV